VDNIPALIGPFSLFKRCKDVCNSYSAELRAFLRSNNRTISERKSLNSSTISSHAIGFRSKRKKFGLFLLEISIT
jgi:hypothetical protein